MLPLALLVVSQKDAKGHYWWFHRRMPGGNKEQQPLAQNQFNIDVHLGESSQQNKVLTSLISTLQPIKLDQCGETEKINTLSYDS